LEKGFDSTSPAFLLANFIKRSEGGDILLVTGPSGCGKTEWCARLVERARDEGFTAAGVLSPPAMSAGRKTGIELVNLASGEKRRLAILRTLNSKENQNTNPLVTEDWEFEASAIEWGNGVLRNLSDCDLLVIDELGPLEFHFENGLQESFRVLDEPKFRLACVVVRPALLAEARQRWPTANVINLCDAEAKQDLTGEPQ
jgi:nucleoside-triphosphatase